MCSLPAKTARTRRASDFTALGGNANFSVTAIYPGLNLKDRATVLAAARAFEDLGVAAYNGAAQYLADASNLLAVGKIVSVEARHASVIRDLLSPLSGDFAPRAFDDAFSPARVAGRAQALIVNQLAFENAPTAFVQGPDANGDVIISQAPGQTPPSDVLDVLQFALLLEYLEAEFYTRGLGASGLIPATDRTVFTTIVAHESAHVTALSTLIQGKGATPRARPSPAFVRTRVRPAASSATRWPSPRH